MKKSSSNRKAAPKPRGRFVSPKKFWTPEAVAQMARDIPPPPREKEFIEIMHKVEGPNLVRIL